MRADAPGRRATLTLDGLWDFEFEGPTARLGGEGHTIRSPGIWQAQFPALRNAQGTGRYRRGVQVPPGWAGKRVVLVLEGVFHESVILVDEVAVAVHGDGWTPIEVDLTAALDGETSFVLGVDARVPDDRNGGRFSQSLAGKQDWYGDPGRNLEAGASRSARSRPCSRACSPILLRPRAGDRHCERNALERRPDNHSSDDLPARRGGGAARLRTSFAGVRIRGRSRQSSPVVAGCAQPL